MRRPNFVIKLAGYVAMLILVMSARADILSNFESDMEGWTKRSGGDSGSSLTRVLDRSWALQMADAAQGNADFYAAPSKFLGDWTSNQVVALTFDYRLISGTPGISLDVLFYSGASDYWRASWDPAPLATHEWTHFYVNVIESEWVHGGSGTKTWQNALADVTGLYLDAEVIYGSETTRVDNFVLITADDVTGDYNGDGVVNAADYVVWRNTEGQTGDGLAADGNGNLVVDNWDYGVWHDHFGHRTVVSGIADAVTIPEPAGWAMLLMLLTAAAFYSRVRLRKFSIAALLCFMTPSAALGQAYYSFGGGEFLNGRSIDFEVDSRISKADGDPFQLRTWNYEGGSNAAGDVIDPGGFDPVLQLYDQGGQLVAQNNNRSTYPHYDAQIDWNTSGMPSQIDTGLFRVYLNSTTGSLDGRSPHWAFDLVTTSDVTLRSFSPVDSLKLGSSGFHGARFESSSTPLADAISDTLVVGASGSALLSVYGILSTPGVNVVGSAGDAQGWASVYSGGTWHGGFGLIVGGMDNSEGELNVHGGGTLDAALMSAGTQQSSYGKITVDGNNATLAPVAYLTLGDDHQARGELFIKNQGYANVDTLFLGRAGAGDGKVTVENPQSLLETRLLAVGGSIDDSGGAAGGTGTLTVRNFGEVTTTSTLSVWEGGTLELSDGGQVSAAEILLEGGTLRGVGLVDITDIAGNQLYNAGVVAPGLSIGTLTVTGSYDQRPEGTLELEIGGPNSSQYDRLVVLNGTARLYGKLRVSLTDLGSGIYVPEPGDSFSFVTVTNGTLYDELGPFDVELPDLGPTRDWWRPIYPGPQEVQWFVMSVTPVLPGDYNNDHNVNAADYVVWRNSLGSRTNLRANGDDTGASFGVIDLADYEVWRTHFGENSIVGSGTAIPEPAAFILLVGGILCCCGHRMSMR